MVGLFHSLLLGKKGFILGDHFRGTPVRNDAAIGTPWIAQNSLNPLALNFIPIVPALPVNRWFHRCQTRGFYFISQVIRPPAPQMANIVSTFNIVSFRMIFEGFHGRFKRTVGGVFLPLIIGVPCICHFRKLFMGFDILNCHLCKFGIKEILPPKINDCSLMDSYRSWSLSLGFCFEGVKGYE